MLSEHYTNQFTPYKMQQMCHTTCEPVCNTVTHPVTGKSITNYKKLLTDPLLKTTWEEAMCKELGRLAQGYKKTEGTNTIHFMTHEQIRNIPKD